MRIRSLEDSLEDIWALGVLPEQMSLSPPLEAATTAAVAATVCLGAVLSVEKKEVLMVDRGRNMFGRIGFVHWIGCGEFMS